MVASLDYLNSFLLNFSLFKTISYRLFTWFGKLGNMMVLVLVIKSANSHSSEHLSCGSYFLWSCFKEFVCEPLKLSGPKTIPSVWNFSKEEMTNVCCSEMSCPFLKSSTLCTWMTYLEYHISYSHRTFVIHFCYTASEDYFIYYTSELLIQMKILAFLSVVHFSLSGHIFINENEWHLFWAICIHSCVNNRLFNKPRSRVSNNVVWEMVGSSFNNYKYDKNGSLLRKWCIWVG